MTGPLKGIRIVEFAGLGPGPFAGMMLADHGAEVIRIDRPGAALDPRDPLSRNRTSIVLDMKNPEALKVARELCKSADGIIEGYRPGVMERLGLGPDVLLADNPKLVYGRMTGWGQFGPYAQAAGHDINYIALSGVLHTVGRAGEKPVPPVNYVGDFGGGGMMLAFGMASALLHAAKTGEGQVIDCAMTDGAASLAAMFYGMRAAGMWSDQRDANLLDGGAHFYDTYTCKDGKWVSIGSIEPQFYALLLEKTGLSNDPSFQAQMDRTAWPSLSEKLAAVIATKTRDEWCALMEGTDVCFAPVLSLAEAPEHAHNKARETFVTVDGVVQPNVAPRFSRTGSKVQGPPPQVGAHTEEALRDWGVDPAIAARLKASA